MLKKISIRFFLLLVILAGLNLVYKFTFYEKDLKENCEQWLQIKQSQQSSEIFYFAESSNATTADDDSTHLSIADLGNLFYPTLKFTSIDKNASHGGVFSEWLNAFNMKEAKPKALVVTLNLRSFDAAWIHSKLETPLQQSIIMARPYPPLINRFALSLQVFDNKTDEQREQAMLDEWKTKQLKFPYAFKYKTVREWDDGMANGGYLKPDGSYDNDKIVLACHYIKTYAFNIDTTNPRIADFDKIAKWCDKNKVSLYLNLLAENIDYADSLVGKELVFLMRNNRDFLVKRYSKNNCTVVDNLESVRGKNYIDQNWTTEHYNEEGRMAIAKNLADSLKKEFKNNYIKAY